MLRIVFLGSKPIGAACFQVLMDYHLQGKLQVVAARTQQRKEFNQDETVENIALQHQIPLLDDLDKIPACDIIISVQHHEILEQRHIDQAAQIALNLHLAPLPEYRGCNQFSFAIMNEENEFGVSIHQIDTQIDHGALLYEDRFPIPKDIWVADLYQIAIQKGYELFEKVVAKMIRKKWKPKTINTKKRSTQIYYRKDIEKIKRLDLEDSLELMERKLRATSMPGFEPPYIIINNKKIPLPKI